ncbi:hypothetical protein JRQ81_012842 [Phrynocephalus forsythii]|uniref:Uncharacterized protein n=1 Tax=Phrynocephalus forsythii TaxID=171643 RepID=A0A9Q0Y4G8_9SAUR|nr:hypothetical protein JRQ81_012842 [Phrynocephalus forsythii]
METVEQILLFCTYYQDLSRELISPIIGKFPGRSIDFYVHLLLSDKCYQITKQVAKFCAVALRVRNQIINGDKEI